MSCRTVLLCVATTKATFAIKGLFQRKETNTIRAKQKEINTEKSQRSDQHLIQS